MRGPKRNYELTAEHKTMKAACTAAISEGRESYEAARALFNATIVAAFGDQAKGECLVAYDDTVEVKAANFLAELRANNQAKD